MPPTKPIPTAKIAFNPLSKASLKAMVDLYSKLPKPESDWQKSPRYDKRPFKVESISSFDARKGYRRCDPPGVGVTLEGRPNAVADLWWDPHGHVCARLTSSGWVESVKVTRVDGKPITSRDTEALSDYVADLIFYWVIEGVDDIPPFCLDSPD